MQIRVYSLMAVRWISILIIQRHTEVYMEPRI